MRHKKDGAEILTTALNAIFGPLVRQVYGGGGMVVSFAGDAFTAVFPLGRNPQQAVHHMLQTASFIQQFVQMQGQINTPYGVFRLGAHTGLGIGQVEWEIIGTPERRTFFFHGTAVESCTTAAPCAQTGEILAAASLAPWLAEVVHAEPWSAALRLSGLPSAAALYPTWRPRLREAELGRITLRTAADLETARQFGAEAQAIARQLPPGREQQWIESLALRQLGTIPMYQADYALAKTYNEESLAICRAINAQEDIAACLNNLGEIARYAEEYTLAASYYEQALDISRMIGMRVMIPIAQVNLGLVATAEGHLMPALQQYMEGIRNALQI